VASQLKSLPGASVQNPASGAYTLLFVLRDGLWLHTSSIEIFRGMKQSWPMRFSSAFVFVEAVSLEGDASYKRAGAGRGGGGGGGASSQSF
jgi:hypothetical protein